MKRSMQIIYVICGWYPWIIRKFYNSATPKQTSDFKAGKMTWIDNSPETAQQYLGGMFIDSVTHSIIHNSRQVEAVQMLIRWVDQKVYGYCILLMTKKILTCHCRMNIEGIVLSQKMTYTVNQSENNIHCMNQLKWSVQNSQNYRKMIDKWFLRTREVGEATSV